MSNQSQETTNTSQSSGMSPKTIAIVSYLTLIGWIIAFVMNNNNKSELGSFHIRQSLGLILMMIAASVIGIIPILGWIIYIVGLLAAVIFWIMGIIGASNSQMKPVPVVGEMFQKWFASL